MTKMYISSMLLMLILIALAIAPAIVLGEDDRNIFLIGVMAISPIIIVINHKFYQSTHLLLMFMLSIVFIPLLHQPDSMRWSTIMYSIMFGLTFIAYVQLLHSKKFHIENYQKILKYLIYAYFVVLLIQQFCVLTGLPIFNIHNYFPYEPWKLNSLSAEPSHSARIVALVMYCYITIKELIVNRKYNFRLDIKQDKWVWVSFLWSMLTMGSGTAFLFIIIVLSKFVRFKNLMAISIIISVIVLLIDMLGITAFERTLKVFIATLTFDVDTIMEADHSASIRIVPMIIVAQMVDLTTLNGWFGHGIDYVSTFLSSEIRGIPEGTSGGGLFQLWIEYGFLSFILFVIFSFSNSYKKGDYLSIVFWFMLVFLYGINSQIVWLTIILLFTNKFFEKSMRTFNEK